MSKINILYLAGMGGDKSRSHEDMLDNLKKKLGRDIQVNLLSVLYLTEMNQHQEKAIRKMGSVGMKKTRGIMLKSFSDAISIYYTTEAYKGIMSQITNGMKDLVESSPSDTPIYIITQSLGCHIFSCWMYDQQQKHNGWSNIKGWFSTGNNMRVFFNGIPVDKIVPFQKPCKEFFWYNFWSKSDPLSFLMENINEAYDELLTTDVKVWGLPIISHGKYGKRKKVYKTIAKAIKKSLVGLDVAKAFL